MVTIKEIHDFAIKYHSLYVSPQTTEREVKDGFADLCFSLGFEMDCGNKFIENFSSDAFYKNNELDKVINDIDDVALLGSAIFSHWRYVMYWDYNSSLLDEEHRPWFITAFERLAIVTEEEDVNTFLFEGKLQKIRLISNNICYGPCPKADDEVEQHLTITSDGRVWLSRYRFGADGDKYKIIERQRYSVSPEVANEIMAAVSDYFSNKDYIEFVTDAGSWELTLTNTDAHTFKIVGSLCFDLQTASGGLSEIIRSKLKRNNLFVFDGNPDAVTKIEIKYHRNTKIKPNVTTEEAVGEYVPWDYNETLIIDRSSETLKHIREIGSGCKVTNIYHVQDGITSFLDGIDVDVFFEVKGNPPDAVDNPLEIKEYTITVVTKHGTERVITGTFDKHGLPTDWSDFINDIYEFMAFYGLGELFDKRIYGKTKRRQSDFIFCNIEFEEGGKTYCYLADSDEYSEGDLVVVPTGRDNHEAVVRIESIEYHSANDAPFPIDKTKQIIRKYDVDAEDD
ncbi:MAG: hypothetical protein HDR72_00245 [Ruminococcaceae bacterium]|nr:hypothetical protein [Oscillospiraceae bacterium]